MSFAGRILTVLALSLAALLAGCTIHYASSAVISPVDAPIERMVIVVQHGEFKKGNMASVYGDKNLQSLTPNLESRLPIMFSLNGIETRAAGTGPDGKPAPVKLQPHEATMFIYPVSAFYSTQSGQHLTLRALLMAPNSPKPVWRADIELGTPGFGKFDADLADGIAVDLLTKLRDDKVIKLPDEQIRKAPESKS